MLTRRSLGVVLASAAAAATFATSAPAAEYSVNVCRHADGTPAPTEGWQGAIADDFAVNDTARESCSVGGQIDLALGAGTAHGRSGGGVYASAVVSFAAAPPAGMTWRRARVWWAFRSAPVTPAEGTDLVAGSAGSAAATCSWGRGSGACSGRGVLAGPPLSDANVTDVTIAPEMGAQPFALSVTCDSSPLPCPAAAGEPYAQLRAWRLLVTLADDSLPIFGTQPALPSTLAGASVPVRISASDAGSGVHTARLLADGTPAGAPVVIDAAGGRCAQQSDGSFDARLPCPATVADAPVTLALTGVPNGAHQLAVRVSDAAGNFADSAPVPVTVAIPPPPVPLAAIPADNPLRGRGHLHNGSGTADSGTLRAGLRASKSGALRTTARILPGHRLRLSGRLAGAGGKPVAGARLVVRSQRPGHAARLASVRTASNGTFTRMLSWGATRRVAVLWYPWGDSTSAVASRSLRVYGAARISLRVSPSAPRNGQALRFAGTAPHAPSGARVTLQVRTAGLWRTFLNPAVDRRGRFTGRRLLTRSAGLSYCFRARILSQRGFAYSAGVSRSVCVRVRRG